LVGKSISFVRGLLSFGNALILALGVHLWLKKPMKKMAVEGFCY